MSDIGKVQVYIRSRPLLPREKKGNTRRSVEFPSDKKKLLISDGDKESKEFAFDYVYDEQQTQERIFDECVKPLIHGCFLGYNAAVLVSNKCDFVQHTFNHTFQRHMGKPAVER